MDLTLDVRGCDEVSQLLKQLPDKLRDKYGVQGLAAAAEITAMAVRSRMPTATGLAKESIGHSPVKIYRSSGTLFTAIEPGKNVRRIVTASASGKNRIRSRRTTSASAAFGRVQDPRRYMHLIESGRKEVTPEHAKALHSALDVQNRYFARASAVAPHPVFAPARDAVEGAAKIAIENELNRGIEEFNRTQNASAT